MKKSIVTLTVFAFTTIAIIIGCKTSSDKVENAKAEIIEANKDLVKANEDLAKANEEYLADIENYKKITSDRMAANDKRIMDFNERISKNKKEATEQYIKKINALDIKHSDMKKKIADYKANGKENWEIFKTEFNQGMDDLDKTFKDLTEFLIEKKDKLIKPQNENNNK